MNTRSVRATITALHIYPVKSCRGLSLPRAKLTRTGFEHDREWLIVQPNGRFITQREHPRLALVEPSLHPEALVLNAPNMQSLDLATGHDGERVQVQIWNDQCAAIDAGQRAAQWLETFLGSPHRLVRFDPLHDRRADPQWTGDIEAFAQFPDAFPWLLISQGSLDELNRRLPEPLPMNRFRPNIVVDGLQPFEEDAITELRTRDIALRPVKPCSRCAITTTDQERGERTGDEPLRTLRSFRFDRGLRGVTFGQNVVARTGLGDWLNVGDELSVVHRA